MQRRRLFPLLAAATAVAWSPRWATAATPAAAPAPPPGTPFDATTVIDLARALAAKPFEPPDTTLPDELRNLKYDQYRSIRFDTTKALWGGQGTEFQAQFFHRGFLYTSRVDIAQVIGGRAMPIEYVPDLFHFDHVPKPKIDNLGFAGFRIHAPINRPDYFDEVCAFLGASYFRAVGRDQVYGLSARGLAIKTADPTGEEFPVFKSFWLERPPILSGARAAASQDPLSMTIWALLDSPSTSAAFQFTIHPGSDTIFDVAVTLFPRTDIAEAGIAPLTSMFYFDADSRSAIDDYRPAVHDSDGLLMLTGSGEQLWRPLANPAMLQFSAFEDTAPIGFGLLQRDRRFAHYQDLEASYQKRPSLWVEPIGDWGQGSVDLVEIPTKEEIHDNIVAFWRPHEPLKAKSEVEFKYRLHWCAAPPPPRLPRATVTQTRIGAGHDESTRLFVIDINGDRLTSVPDTATLSARVNASKGQITHVVVQPIPQGGWRISFELTPGREKLIELNAQLFGADTPLSEIWLYRWTV